MQGDKPKHIVAKPINPVEDNKTGKRELWATVCYYYPQYTLQEAAQLSVRDIKLLLKVAEKIESAKRYEYTQIVAAPHTKKGAGVKKLTEYYRKKMK